MTQGCGGGNDPSTPAGTGGATGMGGTTPATTTPTGSGGATTPATTGAGGTTPTTTAAGGTGGTTDFTPLCGGLLTAAGVAPTKNGICVDTDPQLCYKTCGPQSVGFKSETCTAGVYVEQSGCSFPPADYSCYKIADPFVLDPTCPAEVPQATTACTVAPCTLCNVNGGYLDSSGAAKQGYCVCPTSTTGTSKWSCASSTAWPCPAGQGC